MNLFTLLGNDWNNGHKTIAMWDKARVNSLDSSGKVSDSDVELYIRKAVTEEGYRMVLLNKYIGIHQMFSIYMKVQGLSFNVSEAWKTHLKQAKSTEKNAILTAVRLVEHSYTDNADFFLNYRTNTIKSDRMLEDVIVHLNAVFGALLDDLRASEEGEEKYEQFFIFSSQLNESYNFPTLPLEYLDEDWNNCRKPFSLWENSQTGAYNELRVLNYKTMERNLRASLKSEDDETIVKLLRYYTGLSLTLINYMNQADIPFALIDNAIYHNKKRVKFTQKMYATMSLNSILFSFVMSTDKVADILEKALANHRKSYEDCIVHLNSIFNILMLELSIFGNMGKNDALSFTDHLAELQKSQA